MANTIERKKKKGGKYEYYVADDNGNKLRTLTVGDSDVWDGQEIDKLFYLVSYWDVTDESEAVVFDEYKGDYVTRSEGGGDIDLKALLWNNGSFIFDGIKKFIQIAHRNHEFVLMLEKSVISKYRLDEEQKKSLSKSYRSNYPMNDKEIYCVIDDVGNFVISPTYQKIRYDSMAEDYILEN